MGEVLLFNIGDGKSVKIKMLCRKMNLSARTVEKTDFGKKLSTLLGLTEDERGEAQDFSEEMLYLADISGGMLNLFLNQLRRNKLSVALKAVKTDTNMDFTPFELYREISAEHAFMQAQRGSCHQPEQK